MNSISTHFVSLIVSTTFSVTKVTMNMHYVYTENFGVKYYHSRMEMYCSAVINKISVHSSAYLAAK